MNYTILNQEMIDAEMDLLGFNNSPSALEISVYLQNYYRIVERILDEFPFVKAEIEKKLIDFDEAEKGALRHHIGLDIKKYTKAYWEKINNQLQEYQELSLEDGVIPRRIRIYVLNDCQLLFQDIKSSLEKLEVDYYV